MLATNTGQMLSSLSFHPQRPFADRTDPSFCTRERIRCASSQLPVRERGQPLVSFSV